MFKEAMKANCIVCKLRPVAIKKRQLCMPCYQRIRRQALNVEPTKRGRKPLADDIKEERIADAQRRRDARSRALWDRHQPILERAQSGMSQRSIARALGISFQRVGQILKRYNVSIREFKEPKPKPKTADQRLQEKICRIRERLEKNIDKASASECWIWQGPTDAPNPSYPAYVLPRICAHDPLESSKSRSTYAHRVAYMIYIGPIPKGLVVHRSCHNYLCCNPAHLQLATRREAGTMKNPEKLVQPRIKRPRSHCKHGHLLDQQNVYTSPNGVASCRTCTRQRQEKQRKSRHSQETLFGEDAER